MCRKMLALYRDLLFLGIAGLLSFIWDVTTHKSKFAKCSQEIGACVLHLLHHFIFVFIAFSWLSNQREILIAELVLIVLVLGHWMTNDWQCFFTIKVDDMCDTKNSFKFVANSIMDTNTWAKFFGFSSSTQTDPVKRKRYSRIAQVVFLAVFFIICCFKLKKSTQ